MYVKHGLSGSRLYYIWKSMRQRCMNPNCKNYPRYGGRGITIYPEWDDYEKFNEWALSNGYNELLTIDRIDVNGNYEPGNCKWSTSKEQANNRRTNHLLTHNGETHNIREWAAIMGVSETVIHERLKRGWSIEKTLTQPIRKMKGVKTCQKRN